MNIFRSRKRSEPVVAYTTEPAVAFLFEPSAKYREVTAEKKPRYMLYSPPHKGLLRLTKTVQLRGYLPGLSPLDVEVEHASFEVIGTPGLEQASLAMTGAPGFQSLLDVQSKADAPDREQAERLLDEVRTEVKGGRVRLSNPANRMDQRCLTEFAIICPKDRRVTVRGNYSAVRAADLTGGVEIETNHARIRILNSGPFVKARVEEGIIDYSGCQGDVRLFAGWEVNLLFTSPTFAGRVEARAEGPIRVLIPRGFETCLEANVAKAASFVCRADVTAQIGPREKWGRRISRCGKGTPAVRLVSNKGPIVIDNVADTSESGA